MHLAASRGSGPRPKLPVIARTALCVLLGCSTLEAQDNEERREARKLAGRYLTYLELPKRRTEGAMGLLKIGEHAVPTLMRGALHPDPKIACMAMQVLGELGPVAMAAEGTLHKLSLSEDPVIAAAGSWAKIRVRNQGSFLIAEYGKGRVLRHRPDKGNDKKDLEVILDGKQSCWDVELVGKGNYLVTQYTKKSVAEYTPEGKKVWEYTDVNQPLDADRLPNGNTLISDTFGGRVIEVDPKGKVVWKHDKLKQVYDADRLVDGNTLITQYGTSVIEVTPDGEKVWEYVATDAFGADRLTNGNTLVTLYSSGKVVELDKDGEVVFEIADLKNPNEARRLANGNTAVAENDKVLIFDAKGKKLRTIDVGTRPGTINFH